MLNRFTKERPENHAVANETKWYNSHARNAQPISRNREGTKGNYYNMSRKLHVSQIN